MFGQGLRAILAAMRMELSLRSTLALAMLGAAALAGCTETSKPVDEPTFYRSMAQPDAVLDAETAASMISGFRANNGLPAVTLDPQLMQVAGAQARAMAARNKADQTVGGAVRVRLKRAGYEAKIASENVSAGYHTLAEAFSGWRDSPPHRANMLLRGATKMGIAAVYAPSSKYKVFWSLILAEP